MYTYTYIYILNIGVVCVCVYILVCVCVYWCVCVCIYYVGEQPAERGRPDDLYTGARHRDVLHSP
jgi:hypothetical protein